MSAPKFTKKDIALLKRLNADIREDITLANISRGAVNICIATTEEGTYRCTIADSSELVRVLSLGFELKDALCKARRMYKHKYAIVYLAVRTLYKLDEVINDDDNDSSFCEIQSGR